MSMHPKFPGSPSPKPQEASAPATPEPAKDGGPGRAVSAIPQQPSPSASVDDFGPVPTPAAEVSVVRPHRLKENGCEVYSDENAKAKLMEWGYPYMSGSRYPFDTGLKGWEQFDTWQDAPYYGIWTSVDRMATVSYTEGDVYLVVAPSPGAFRDEVRSLWDWSYKNNPSSGHHTQLDSPRLTTDYLKGHPPFDQVMSDYHHLEALEHRYEALQKAVYEALEDPTLPKGRFHIRQSKDHVFFIRGHAGDSQVFCAGKLGDYDLNFPEYTFHPYCGNASTLPRNIEILEGFLAHQGKLAEVPHEDA